MLGLVAFIQAASFAAVYLGARSTVIGDARDRLAVGGRVFTRLLDNRARQLDSAVEVLASDFGFKQAVASGNRETIRSALLNQASRVDADMVLLVDPNGQTVTGSHDDMPGSSAFAALFAGAQRDGNASGTVYYQGQAYQMVIVPVYAPLPIGWVCMGFAMDRQLARDLRGLTGLEVSFVSKGGADIHVDSTLELARAQALERMQDQLDSKPGAAPQDFDLAGEHYLTLSLALAGGAQSSVTAVLQNSLKVALQPYDLLKEQLIAIALSALVVSLVLALFLGRSLSRPLRVLARAAQRVEAGDYSEAVHMESSDEVSELAGAFNSMQSGIAEREERIAHQAFHDVLTGIANRISIQQQIEVAIGRATRKRTQAAVLFLDINRFKDVNDTLGHQTGDHVLMESAQRLRRAMRPGAAVARLGADQFLVLLEDADAGAAQEAAARMVDALQAQMDIADMQINLGVSVGIALFPEHGEDTETLIRRAEIAMYDAKEARVSLQLYASGRDERYRKSLELISDLRRAVERDELRLHFQPKVDAHDLQVVGVEVLLRWEHPRLGFVPPDEFIPLAEQSGNIKPITDWVLRRSIEQCRDWKRSGWTPIVAVNLSAMDLLDEQLPARISDWLRANNVPPRQLMLEVTESAVMRDPQHATQVLHRLKASGVRLSIDDFGTGYSSLAQLKQLPVEELKIDRSFIMQLREHGEDAVIVRSTIELAHNMGLQVTAEGVETEEGLRFLQVHKCDQLQGYYISRPLPLEKLESWLGDYRKVRRA